MPSPEDAYDPMDISVHDMDATYDPETGVHSENDEETQTDPEDGRDSGDEDPNADITEDGDDEEGKTESDESKSNQADGGDEDDEELKELGFPALPEELAANEEISKRYTETQYGISKLLRQQQEVVGNLRKYETLAADLTDISNPELAQNAYKHIGEIIEKEFGVKVLGTSQVQSQQTPQISDVDGWDENQHLWEQAGLTKADYAEAVIEGVADYPGEYKAFKRAVSKFESRFEKIEQKDKAAEALKAEQAFLDQEAPRAIGFLAKTENGWGVTKDMVSNALKQFPNMKGDIPKAVKMTYPDEFANHKAQAILKAQGKEGPEMLTKGGSGSKGTVLHRIDPDAPMSESVHLIAENLAALSK